MPSQYILVYLIFVLSHNPQFTDGNPLFSINRRAPVEGKNIFLTCVFDVPITKIVRFFKKPNNIQGGCKVNEVCDSSISEYFLSLNISQKTLILMIPAAAAERDSGIWFCNQAQGGNSNNISLASFASALDWNQVSFNPSLSSLPASVTPEDIVIVTVITPCAFPQAKITWTFEQKVGYAPPSSISVSKGSCSGSQTQTTSTMTLSGNTSNLFSVSLVVSVEHDSFDPPTYTKSISSNLIQFPVAVSSVEIEGITEDNEIIRSYEGEQVTLTCVTSPCLPAANVTWSGLPLGVTPTTIIENTSSLSTTKSSVSFTITKSRSVICVAVNMEDQPYVQSKRPVLEVCCSSDDSVAIGFGVPLLLAVMADTAAVIFLYFQLREILKKMPKNTYEYLENQVENVYYDLSNSDGQTPRISQARVSSVQIDGDYTEPGPRESTRTDVLNRSNVEGHM